MTPALNLIPDVPYEFTVAPPSTHRSGLYAMLDAPDFKVHGPARVPVDAQAHLRFTVEAPPQLAGVRTMRVVLFDRGCEIGRWVLPVYVEVLQ